MQIQYIILIALALSMDAFAVSMSSGASIKKPKISQALIIALFFGFFQFLMPLIGWFLGNSFKYLIESFDHWVAFFLLLFIGGKMIYESQHIKEGAPFSMTIKTLFILAIATSIDALGAGLSMSFLETSTFIPSLIIGAITFIISLFGVYMGKILGHILESKAEFIGGVILMGIGTKILIEHIA